MWIGLLTDIHANREALEATLDHARRAGISRLIFLGDYVGYGADPGFAVNTVIARSSMAQSRYSAITTQRSSVVPVA